MRLFISIRKPQRCSVSKKYFRKAALVINTKSRKGERLFFDSIDLLGKEGIEIEKSYPARTPEILHESVVEAIAKGYKLVIVGGGDGTLSSVVKHFAGKDVVMGVLPLGTGNSFARSLNLPLNLKDYVKVIAQGQVAEINLGKIGKEYFANVASIGFNAKVAKHTPDQLKKYLGFFAYGLVGLRLFVGKSSFKATIKIGRDTIEGRYNQLVIANGSFFGITKIYDQANIKNNELVVISIDASNRRQIIKSWFGFMIGRPKMFSGVKIHGGKEVQISTNPVLNVDIDGEEKVITPITATLVPNALKVMVPK